MLWQYPQVSYREGQTTQQMFTFVYGYDLPDNLVDEFEVLVKWRSNMARNRKLRWRPYALYRFPSREEVKEMLDGHS